MTAAELPPRRHQALSAEELAEFAAAVRALDAVVREKGAAHVLSLSRPLPLAATIAAFMPRFAAPRALPPRLRCQDVALCPGSRFSIGRNTTASMALITLRCMISLLSIVRCAIARPCSTSTFSSSNPGTALVSRDRFAVPIGDVEVDVTPNTPCEAGAENRIQADRELNGNAKAVQALAAMSGRAVAPEECPTRMMVLVRPLLYSAAASSASDDQER